jgi:hypothetical protein
MIIAQHLFVKGQNKKFAIFLKKGYFIKKQGRIMNKDEIIKIITKRTFISQVQAAEILNITRSQISLLIKKGKIEAYSGGKTPKPYLDSVLSYKTNPNMKRNISVNGNNNIVGNGNNNTINIKK